MIVTLLFTSCEKNDNNTADDWRNTISAWTYKYETLTLFPFGTASYRNDDKYRPQNGSGNYIWTDDTHIKFTDFIITGDWDFIEYKLEEGTLEDFGYMQRLHISYRTNTANNLNHEEPVWSEELKTNSFTRVKK